MNTDLLSQIVTWGEGEAPIRALILVGSRGGSGPVDALSDYDISVFSTTHEPYTNNDVWLSQFGKVWLYLSEQLVWKDTICPTRLVIYEGGTKIDFAFYPLTVLYEMTHADQLPETMDTGYRVLLDKDKLCDHLPQSTGKGFRPHKPTEQEFQALVNEFWFEVYHIAKYLKRDELWPVKFRDWWVKDRLVLRMLEWHQQATHGWDYNTGYEGRHMKEWLPSTLFAELQTTFANADPENGWQALMITLDLFRRTAQEVAEMLGYAYLYDIDRNITQFVCQLRDEEVQIGAHHNETSH